jgi:transposase-like protein
MDQAAAVWVPLTRSKATLLAIEALQYGERSGRKHNRNLRCGRYALAHVGPSQRPMVAAAIRTAFTQETADAAHQEWRAVADRLRDRFRKLAELMDEAEDDVLAHMAFPKHHWRQLHSTNPLERLNGEIKRRTDVVAIFPNEDAIVRLVGALLLEQNDEWAVTRRYMTLETLDGLSDDAGKPRRIAAA